MPGESLCDSGPVPIMLAPCVALPVIFLSRISSKNILKKTSHFLDPGMCVICVEFLPFQWRIPFHSLHFSGHKPIVWSLADCLINEPFLLLFFNEHTKKERNPLWSESLVEQVMPQPNYSPKQRRKKVYWTNWRRIYRSNWLKLNNPGPPEWLLNWKIDIKPLFWLESLPSFKARTEKQAKKRNRSTTPDGYTLETTYLRKGN